MLCELFHVKGPKEGDTEMHTQTHTDKGERRERQFWDSCFYGENFAVVFIFIWIFFLPLFVCIQFE